MTEATKAVYGEKQDRGAVTFIGNIGKGDVGVRYTAEGNPVATFTVGRNSRVKDAAGEWTDGPATWRDVVVFHNHGAEHVANSFATGDRVIVAGRLKSQTVTRGDQVTERFTIEAEEVGGSSRWADVAIDRSQRRAARQDRAFEQVAEVAQDPWTQTGRGAEIEF